MSGSPTPKTRIVASTGDDLDRELARRLTELRDHIAPDEDCVAGSRPILVRALYWTVLGFALWLVGVLVLS